jgi:hypothetical protein
MDLILEKRNDLKENYMHVFFFLRDFSVAKKLFKWNTTYIHRYRVKGEEFYSNKKKILFLNRFL